MQHQLPAAIITLKQGIGRLIRDCTDRGVLVVCDPRLRTRSYGRIFLNSLPAMPRTRSLDAVRDFFAEPLAPGPAAKATL
jgi:ATP-dependent DNA helicase DinG